MVFSFGSETGSKERLSSAVRQLQLSLPKSENQHLPPKDTICQPLEFWNLQGTGNTLLADHQEVQQHEDCDQPG
jgi:hypothetical protein